MKKKKEYTKEQILKNEKYLERLVLETKKDMKEAEIYVNEKVPVRIDYDLIEVLGQTRRKNNNSFTATIYISGKVFEYIPKDSENLDIFIKNIICHELIHAIPKCINDGHRGYWKLYADKMNKKNSNYNIKRLMQLSDYIIVDEIEDAKYIIVCKNCGLKHFYQRKSKVITKLIHSKENNVNSNYICAYCKSENLDIIIK